MLRWVHAEIYGYSILFLTSNRSDMLLLVLVVAKSLKSFTVVKIYLISKIKKTLIFDISAFLNNMRANLCHL